MFCNLQVLIHFYLNIIAWFSKHAKNTPVLPFSVFYMSSSVRSYVYKHSFSVIVLLKVKSCSTLLPCPALFPLINMEHATYFCRCIWWQKETSLSPWSLNYQKKNGFPCQVHGVINLGKWPGSDCKILTHRRLLSILLSNQYQCPETGLKLDSYSVNLLVLSGSWAWHGHILCFLNDVVEIPMVIVRLLFDQVFSLPMYGNIKGAPI